MSRVVVFLGPSLPVGEARAVLDADYRPPAALGDLCAALADRPDAIALVDGVFERVPAVWHKEILFALSQGVPVYGASSMGALRAAELSAFGMIGVGEVFEAYRDGALEDDDEVAVVHAPSALGYRACSEAMVNIRDGLRQARRTGLIERDTEERLLALAKGQFYPHRSWESLHEAGVQAGLDARQLERLMAFVRRMAPNVKRRDAVALLQRVREDAGLGFPKVSPDFQFEHTVFWERVAEGYRGLANAAGVDLEAVAADAGVFADDWDELRSEALALFLSGLELERRGISLPDEKVVAAAERFRRERDLHAVEATHEFLLSQSQTVEQFFALMRATAGRDELFGLLRPHLLPAILDALRLRGRAGEVAARAATVRALLNDAGLVQASPAAAALSAEELLAWYESRFRPIRESHEEHALARGFPDIDSFLSAVAAAYLLEHR